MVFLKDEQLYAELVTEGAHVSRVKYLYGGIEYDVLVENNEIEFLDDDLGEEME
jgi:hypothetical protein